MVYKNFSIGNLDYVYDTSSGQIIKVEKPLKDVISLYNLPSEKIHHRLNGKFSKAKINEALEALDKLRSDHSFGKNRIKKFSLPFKITKENLKNVIKKELSHMVFGVTNQCNLRCRYCTYSGNYVKERVHNNDFMDFETAIKALVFFMKFSETKKKKFVTFFGGEPLLSYEILKKIVGYSKQKFKKESPKFLITTNGTIMNKEIATFLIDNNLGVYISLDGPLEIHDKYRIFKNGKGSYNKILKNLEILKKLDEKYYREKILFQITLAPPYNLFKIKKFLETEGMVNENFFMINWVNSVGTELFKNEDKSKWGLKKSLNLLENEFIEEFSKGEEKKIKYHFNYFLGPLMRIHKRKIIKENGVVHPNGICIPGSARVFITPKGELKICNQLDNFTSIGNVIDGYDYDKIIYLINTYIEYCNNECKTCWAACICNLCFVQAHNINDLSVFERNQYCQNVKDNIYKNLILYTKILNKNKFAFDKHKAQMDELQEAMLDED